MSTSWSSQLKPALETKGAVVVEMGSMMHVQGNERERHYGRWEMEDGWGKARMIQASKV